MRPIERGSVPKNKDGTDKVYKQYNDAKSDLIKNMGRYCSYCGMCIPASLAVEHVQPKQQVPDLKLSWDNFLLACVNCNSTKSRKNINKDNKEDYYWPDTNNTHIPFVYDANGQITINDELTSWQKIKAQNTLSLVGLQVYKYNTQASDSRWMLRKETYAKAEHQLLLLTLCIAKGAEKEAIELICSVASGCGFFSIWFSVFKDHNEVKKALIEAFTGTCSACFDAANNYQPLWRNPNDL